MKKKSLFVLLLFSAFYLSAQDNCMVIDDFDPSLPYTLTEAAYQNFPWYNDSTFLDNYYDSLSNAMNNSSPQLRTTGVEDTWLRVPVHFWAYRNDNGSPGGSDPLITERRLQFMLDDINTAFRNSGIKFRFYVNGIDFINDSGILTVTNRVQRIANAQRPDRRKLHKVNIHIVQSGGNEYFWDTDAIYINRDVYDNEDRAETFTHEMGHYFGLMHTHFGHNTLCYREPVSRGIVVHPCPPHLAKRCKVTGDLLADTPADPNMGGNNTNRPDRNNCTYVRNQEDYYGRKYQPDPSNYMAYGNTGCAETFTKGQRNWMYFWAFRLKGQILTLGGWHPNNNNAFDVYEPNDAGIAARPLPIGEVQSHSFHVQGRQDNVDWLSFQYPENGSISNWRLEVKNLTSTATGNVNIHIRDQQGNPGLRIQGVTESSLSGKRIFTIPCGQLVAGSTYLIEVTRGNAGTGRYEVELVGGENTYQISGSSTVCFSNTSTFRINNLPAGVSVNWTRSANLGYVSGQGTANFSVRATSSSVRGDGWVRATLVGGCGSLPPITKNFWVGGPGVSTSLTFTGSNCILKGSNNVYAFYANPYPYSIPGVIYEWNLSGSFSEITVSPSTSNVYATVRAASYVSSGLYAMNVIAKNSCGEAIISSLITFYVYGNGENCSGGIVGPTSITFPNPATDYLQFNLSETEVNFEKGYEVKIYDTKHTELISVRSNNKTLKNVDIAKIPKGVYIINIIHSEGVLQERLVVE